MWIHAYEVIPLPSCLLRQAVFRLYPYGVLYVVTNPFYDLCTVPSFPLYVSALPCSGAKVGACLLSNTCLGLGVEVFAILERRREGLLWSNAGSDISTDDNFSMVWVFGMLIIDSILYMGVAW
jgi:hypothetical protein